MTGRIDRDSRAVSPPGTSSPDAEAPYLSGVDSLASHTQAIVARKLPQLLAVRFPRVAEVVATLEGPVLFGQLYEPLTAPARRARPIALDGLIKRLLPAALGWDLRTHSLHSYAGW